MNINKMMNIKEIITKFPETTEIFTNNGIKGLDQEEVLEKLEKFTLEDILKMKKVNIDSFIKFLEEAIDIEKSNNSLSTEQKKEENEDISIMGLLPCPVRLPLIDIFTKFLDKNKDIKVNYELKAASSSLGWLKEDVIKADRSDMLADMFISAGFDLFFEKNLMGKFKKRGIFKDITGIEVYNEDFKDLKDPEGDYSMIGVVPAIFLVNTTNLGDREMPKTWADILKPEFRRSVSLPISDFDLFNAILVNINKNYGEEGVKALGESLMSSMHPAEMVGSKGPTITIMPYFFSKMIKEGGPMVPVWPEDGAIISPIFMLTKEEKKEKLKPVAEFMSGKEVGEILSHQGLFPSINPEVENKTKGKPMMWVGWDYIYSNDIGSIIKFCEEKFNEGASL